MKESLHRVALYFIQEWLAFLVIFGVIALIFGDPKLMGWAMLGRLLGITFFDKKNDA